MQVPILESPISPRDWAFIQALPQKPVYSVKNDAAPIAGSKKTAYRRLAVFKNMGIIDFRNRHFSVNHSVTRQPYRFIDKLIPSLLALKNARRFGRTYNDADIRFVKKHLPDNSFVTLDFKAWELTKFQEPSDLFVYADSNDFVNYLKESGFSEGTMGHVVLLPISTKIENEIEQVYFDSIAKGGRSVLDAIALELLYPDKIRHKGQFPVDYVAKVQEDMARLPIEA
ncbi:MAG: hypothetical protein QXG67_02710, partial [Candidatus Nitrosotenuis sp.]